MENFKKDIAKQLSDLSGKDESDIINMLEIPNNTENGDLSLAIPKLRLKGNPKDIAKELSEKVF